MVDGTAAPLGSVREMLYGIKLDELPAPLRTMLARFDKNGNGIIDPDELPIANDDGISIKAFPENVQPFLREIDEEGNGKLEMGELTEMATTYVELKKANKEGSIAIKTLPKEIQPTLKVFDVDGDGTVAPMELARGAELYKGSKKTAKRLMMFTAVLLLVLCALVGVIVGLTAVVVEEAKETKTDQSGITKVKNSDKVVATAEATKSRTILEAPKMTPKQLDSVTSLTLNNNGTTYKYSISGYQKQTGEVTFFSMRGETVRVTHVGLSVTDASGQLMFRMSAADLSSSGRRLLVFAVVGMFMNGPSSGYSTSSSQTDEEGEDAHPSCYDAEYFVECPDSKSVTKGGKEYTLQCRRVEDYGDCTPSEQAVEGLDYAASPSDMPSGYRLDEFRKETDWKRETWKDLKKTCNELSGKVPGHLCEKATMKEYLDDDDDFARYVKQTHVNNPSLGKYDTEKMDRVQTKWMTNHPACQFEPVKVQDATLMENPEATHIKDGMVCMDKADAEEYYALYNQYTTTTTTTTTTPCCACPTPTEYDEYKWNG